MKNEVKKAAKMVDGVLSIECDMFIVPNSFNRANSFVCNADRYKESANVILVANGLAEEADPLLMQVWMSAEDTMGCENLNCHYGKYIDENGDVKPYGQLWSCLPASLFKDAKEGDTVEVRVPAGVYHYSDKFDTMLKITLAQTKYRYRSFGNFENVYEVLLSKTA